MMTKLINLIHALVNPHLYLGVVLIIAHKKVHDYNEGERVNLVLRANQLSVSLIVKLSLTSINTTI